MKRCILLLSASLLLAACSSAPQTDRLLGPSGAVLSGMEALVSEQALESGLLLREVAFVNTGSKPVSVGAMETSRIEIEGADVWSLQPSSTAERQDWVLPVSNGFYQRNFLGMNDPDYGGGIPLVSLWTASRNVSVGVAEPVLKLVSLPVTRKGNRKEKE